jgi:hypothetical protein
MIAAQGCQAVDVDPVRVNFRAQDLERLLQR